MTLSACVEGVDNTGREMTEHGKPPFPLACYHDNLVEAAVPWHWHEELEGAIVTEGEIEVAVDCERYRIGTGDGFFINSGALHGCWNAGAPSCRLHSQVFHPRLVGGSMDSVYWNKYITPLTKSAAWKGLHLRREIGWHREILDSLERSWQSTVHETPGFEFAVRGELSRVVFRLWEHMGSGSGSPSAKALRDSSRIKQMLEYIHAHYFEEINLGQIAGSALVSESECLRCFRGTIGKTPIQYVKAYRLQRAAELLKNTGEKVVDIGVQCGFADMSYFAKAFREAYGCPPTQYREDGGNYENRGVL